MSLKLTRAIIDAIHDDILVNVPTKTMPIFGLNMPESCPNVPTEILDPKNTWADKVLIRNLKNKGFRLIFLF